MNDWLPLACLFCTGAAALSVLFLRNVFQAVLALLATLLFVAVLYILLAAEFLAVTQVLIYAGGIIVILIFGIMLTARISGKPQVEPGRNRWVGLLTGLGFLALFTRAILQSPPGMPAPRESGDHIRNLGVLLFTRYAFAFELAGLLLLVSLVVAGISAFSKPHSDA
jgi:NADH-quinone oxidoreductase subunit J